MKNMLPKNWVETDLDTVVLRMTNGSSLKQEEEPFEGSLPISRIETIWNETIDLDRVKYVDASEEDIKKYGLLKGDVLFSHINSDKHLGKTAVFNLDQTIIHGINLLLLRAMPQFDGDLLNYILRHYRFSGKFIEVAQRSVNQSSINQKKLKSFAVPLPPLAEQQRIVAKLDELFGHLDTLKTRLNNIPQILKNFREAVLTQAVIGKLTEEWRVGKELGNEYRSIQSEDFREINTDVPDEWVVLAFSSVASINSNLVNPDLYLELPYVTPDCIEKESGQLIKEQLVEDIKPVSDKHLFEANSIIYSKIRPYLSKLTIANYRGLCSADMYPIKTELILEYLFYYMLSSQFLSYANTAGTRSVLPKINQKGLSKIPVLVPSKEEQTEIVKRVEHLFAKADKIEAQYQTLKTKIDSLPQAILAKAFKGELVAQLDTDGDAKELLEEIQRLKAEEKKKARKKSTKKSNIKISKKEIIKPNPEFPLYSVLLNYSKGLSEKELYKLSGLSQHLFLTQFDKELESGMIKYDVENKMLVKVVSK
ncbi:restriction endonuclease subunit S [Formosa undariae]|uniref:Restriction endonuclease subunit S n=1 Tax=Formosa undariae TaxID=1325436 RepID=A0ABV5F3I1_9FLAO